MLHGKGLWDERAPAEGSGYPADRRQLDSENQDDGEPLGSPP